VLWIGVLLFAGLSTYANLLHGVMYKSDIDLSKWTSNKMIMSWLDFLRPVLMSGVLPLLVVYLSEIAGSDVSYVLDVAKKEERKRQRDVSTETIGVFPMPVGQAREHRRLSQEQALANMLAFYTEHPGATHAEAGRAVGRSRSWISAQLKSLEQAGVISRNGDGIVIHQVAQE
jgi:hypothetical protein